MALDDELEALLDLLRPLVPQLPNICWIANGDAAPDYCVDCAEAICIEHNATAAPEDEWLVDGGWESYRLSDVSSTCAKCGKLLSYSLTECGLGEEIAYCEATEFPNPLTPEAAFEVEAVLIAARHHTDEAVQRAAIDIGKRAVAAFAKDAA